MTPRPPRLARRLSALLLPVRVRSEVLGDLEEHFAARWRSGSRAQLWYWRAALACAVRLWLERIRGGLRAGAPVDSPGIGAHMDSLLRDLRGALRALVGAPGVAAVVILTVGLGVGANTAVFSVVHGVLLRPLPYPDAERLVVIKEFLRERGAPGPGEWGAVSYPNFLDWGAQDLPFEGMAAVGTESVVLRDATPPRQIRIGTVNPELFALLATDALLGRPLRSDDEADAVVLAEPLWRVAFGGDPQVVGRRIVLDSESVTVVGVMPARFLRWSSAQLWRPLTPATHSLTEERSFRAYGVVARLRPGVGVGAARAAIRLAAARVAAAYPEANASWDVEVTPLHAEVVGPVRGSLRLLFGAVGLLLLIACSNVASLLLARVGGRRREVAVRRALGATRLRVAQQLLVESLVLAVAGGAVGLVIARVAVPVLIGVAPAGVPRIDEVAIDPQVAAFAFGVTLAVGLLVGLLPALQGSSRRDAAGGTPHARVGRFQGGTRFLDALVVAEVALAVVLLLAAGLMVQSFLYLWGYAPGFDPDGVLVVRLSPDEEAYPEAPHQAALYERIYSRIGALPGVESVGGITRIPVGDGDIQQTVRAVGGPAPGANLLVGLRPVSGDYFATMRVPVLAGRSSLDEPEAEVLVNRSAARALFPDTPLERVPGRALRDTARTDQGPELRVVGVVGDVRHGGLDPAPRPEIYVAHALRSFGFVEVVLRTRGDPLAAAGEVREAIAAVDPRQPILEIVTMSDVIASKIAGPRFHATLFGIFGLLAAVLCAVGIVGVSSHWVSRRQYELGVRAALGARPADLLRMVLGRGMLLCGLGAGVGLGAGLLLSGLVRSLLYGVEATDVRAFVAVVVTLLALAAAALAGPGRRAARADPLVAIRSE